uniref:Piperic acid synthase CYP719A37 n=1 Tax=Piper nigrum TaxID=13216 RepID=C719A_PIPNI|nr:cytochrome P450 dependent monooxygenase [Piper nigrum]
MEQAQWVDPALFSAFVSIIFFFLGMFLGRISLGVGKGAAPRSPSSTEWPDGPPKLPIIGNLHQLNKGGELVHHKLAKLAQSYDRAMTIWVGSWGPMIVVSDADLAWEVLVTKSPDFAGRVLSKLSHLFNADYNTVVAYDAGPQWQSLRRGLQHGPLGPAHVSAQARFHEEDMKLLVSDMMRAAKKGGNNGVVEPLAYVRRATIRFLSRLCFGEAFNDEAFVEGMDEAVEETIRATGHARILDAFYFTRHLPIIRRSFMNTVAAKKKIESLVRPLLSRPAPPGSYLHFLLSTDAPESMIIFRIFEVYLLGVDSTASTTTWALAFLVSNQQAQEKLHNELAQYCASQNNQNIKAEDVGKLSYLLGVVKETMRMKPIAPLAVPHKTLKETMLDGKRVAAGTTVVVNLYAVHYNPKLWPEPEQFRPERFVIGASGGNGGGSSEYMLQSYLPFGGGMRACAGMEVGKLQVAMVVANLVMSFKWLPEAEGKMPDLAEDMTFVLMMKKPLAAKIVPRA